MEATGLTTQGKGLTVTFGGKTYPVESVADAQRKWVQFQETAEAGVSQVGNGVEIHDQTGRQVARVSFNGRAWDMNDNLIAEAPDMTAAPAAAPQAPAGNAGNAGNALPRPKARQHPPTVRGSGALAEVSRALGGVSPDLLADLSEKVIRNRTSKTGKKTQYTSWDNPAIPGVGPLFRKGGTGDIAEVARVLEEAGYLEAGANDRDPIGAAQRAQEIIRGELRKGGSATQVGNADAIDAEMRARLEAEMDAAADPWDDFSFTPDDLDESGYADLNQELQLEVERLIAEADQAGLDTETIREDVARMVGEEASQDEYNAAVKEAIQGLLPRVGRATEQAQPSRPQQGDRDGIEAAGDPSQEGSRGRGRQGGPDQVDDWRERAGQKARTSFELDVERSIAGSAPVVSNDIAREAASGWRSAVERRVGKWGLVDNQMDSVDRITLIKGNDLAHFYYRKGDAADRARATLAAEAWAKNDGNTPEAPREALTLEAQTEDDLRAKTEREEAAAKQAAAEKAAEQERLRREAEARDNKARADATVDDFQLGQTAEQQMSGMDDLFGASSEAQQEPAADAPKLTQAEAKDLMSWQDMGQSGGVKTHALHFYENQADKDAKRGRMTLVRVTKEDRSDARWTVEGDDRKFAMLGMAKKAAEEIGMARAVSDGFVQAPAQAAEAKPQAAPALAPEVSAPTKPAPTESPKDATLEEIFDGLQSRGLKKKNATEAAKAHPLAERITLVDKHILDILGDLDDSGTIKINC